MAQTVCRHHLRLLLVVLAVASMAAAISSRIKLIETTVVESAWSLSLQFTSVSDAAASIARTMEHDHEDQFEDDSQSLLDMTYVSGDLPYLVDARSTRLSEVYVASSALDTSPDPPLNASVNGSTPCACAALAAAFCAAQPPATGHSCMTCARACELSFFIKQTAALNPVMYATAPQYTIVSNWYVTRGNGSAAQDINRVWVYTSTTTDLSLKWANATLGSMIGGSSGNFISYYAYPRTVYNRDAVWSSPYIDSITKLPAVTVAVPMWSDSGEFLGGFFADVLMANSRYMFGSNANHIVMYGMITDLSGSLVTAANKTMTMFFDGGTCTDMTVCSVSKINAGLLKWALKNTDSAEYYTMRFNGIEFYVFHQAFASQNWMALFFVPSSEAHVSDNTTLVICLSVIIPVVGLAGIFALVTLLLVGHMRSKVKQLRAELGNVSSDDVLGAPAESVIKTLLQIKHKRGLPKQDKLDLMKTITLIASNNLYKADVTLRQKLSDLKVEKDVGAYLVDFLNAKADQEDGTAAPLANQPGDQPNAASSVNAASAAMASGHASVSRHGSTRSIGSNNSHTSRRATSPVIELEEFSDVAIDEVRTVVLRDGRAVSLDSWDFDVELVKVAPGVSALEAMGAALLDASGVLTQFKFSRAKVFAFLQKIERGYNSNPYHNSVHAADVAQATYSLVTAYSTQVTFSPLERLASILAALMHDYGHFGVNNNYLQATFDPLFLQYNGISVLESMHAAESCKVLLSPDTNFLAGKLSREDIIELHRLITQLILATDMSRHLELTSKFSARITSITLGAAETTKADRLLLLQMLIKMADVSNPSRRWDTCYRWAARVLEEFCLQGDMERKNNIPISPFMDRTTAELHKCQSAFIQYVVQPMVELLGKSNPKISNMLGANVAANAQRWHGFSSENASTGSPASHAVQAAERPHTQQL